MSKLNELYYSGGPIFKRLYELEADTNAYTDAEKAELDLLDGALESSVTAGGTVDAITADFTPNLTLTDGVMCVVRAAGANLTSTPTFAPDGLTAKTIKKNGNNALVPGDIYGAGHELLLKYNLTNDVWELLNPARSDCIVEHEVTGSAVTSIDITGLDINTDKSYRVEIDFINATGSSTNILLYTNNDTTSTNYYTQRRIIANTTTNHGRTNSSLAGTVAANVSTSFIIKIMNVDSTTSIFSEMIPNTGANVEDRAYKISPTTTNSNITQITITGSVASSIGVGTIVRIYHG